VTSAATSPGDIDRPDLTPQAPPKESAAPRLRRRAELSVELWTSPAPGPHKIVVVVADEQGDTTSSLPADFFMP
jgi:hypothetical protein